MENEVSRFSIPKELRFGLIWTIFFIIVGIIAESFKVGSFVFTEFFSKNYLDWIKLFTNPSGANQQLLLTGKSFFQLLAEKWYYFFYTGGLLSLIWGILHWLINLEISFKNRKKQEELQVPHIQLEKPSSEAEIEQALGAGAYMLSQGDLLAAKAIYAKIKARYQASEDKEGKLYRRILDFYTEIVEESSPKKKQVEEWEG